MTTTEWWTVPQVAAWIRTRDFDLVRGLDPFVDLPMAMADAVAPGAFEARHLLKAALANDRFSARGRSAVREITETGWTWRYLETDPQHIPLSFWTDDAGDFDILSNGVAATSATAVGEYWADVSIMANDCVAHWPRPVSLLEAGSVRLVDIMAQLQPEDCLAWWLTHPDVTVTGLDSAGVRVPVDRDNFGRRFTIDSDCNSLTAEGFRWPAPMVCITSDAPQVTASPAPLILAPEPLPTRPDIQLQKVRPAPEGSGNTPYFDDKLVAWVVQGVDDKKFKSCKAASEAIPAEQLHGASLESARKRIQSKALKVIRTRDRNGCAGV
jgi:hypothetical protein